MTIQSWKPDGEDLVIVDEAHHACARTWKEKLLECPKVLGFTATPQRLDGGGLDVVFDHMVVGPSTAELIRSGWLSQYRIFAPPGHEAVAAFRDGRVKLLLSVDLISEGFDVPACDCVLLLRPTHSLGLYLQQVGRALRPSDQDAIILDAAGNSQRHGTPDESRVWKLHGTKKERAGLVADLPVRVCARCYAVHRPHLRTCPYCGYTHPLDSRIPEERDIILKEKAVHAKQMRREVGRARTVEELEAIAKERGYHPAWVDRVLSSRNIRRY